jgi:hypothetical protein
MLSVTPLRGGHVRRHPYILGFEGLQCVGIGDPAQCRANSLDMRVHIALTPRRAARGGMLVSMDREIAGGRPARRASGGARLRLYARAAAPIRVTSSRYPPSYDEG